MNQLSKLSQNLHLNGVREILKIAIQEIKQAIGMISLKFTQTGGVILTKRALSNLKRETNLVHIKARKMPWILDLDK